MDAGWYVAVEPEVKVKVGEQEIVLKDKNMFTEGNRYCPVIWMRYGLSRLRKLRRQHVHVHLIPSDDTVKWDQEDMNMLPPLLKAEEPDAVVLISSFGSG